jgi:hypothetical protein
MALYYDITPQRDAISMRITETLSGQWNIGSDRPRDWDRNLATCTNLSIQADGDELEAIRRQFTGIRMHSGRVVTLFGDDARFVLQHLA